MRFRVILCAAFVVAAGCSSSSTSTTPTPVPFMKLYVTNFVGSGNGLVVYAPPFSAASTPTITVPASVASGLQDPGGIAVDASGKVYTINDIASPSVITIYTTPLSAASTPTTSITLPASSNAYGLALDPAGDIWASDRNGAGSHLYEYVPPFTNTSTPALTLTAAANGLNDASGIAFDNLGHMAVVGETTSNAVVYTAPFSVSSMPTATFALSTAGQGAVFDSTGRLFAVNSGGAIQVFTPPFSNTSTESFHFGATSGFCIAPKFDFLGNLWITNSGMSSVVEYSPPFSASTTAALTINTGLTNNYGLAFGP
jgi:hypothetical protein